MGVKRSRSKRPALAAGLAETLFSGTQRRVLGLLFGQPGRSFYASEIIGLTGGGSGAIQRELAQLAESGLVLVSAVGNQKHYQANAGSPIFEELRGIVMKTVGLADPIRAALAPFVNDIAAAFVYGSVAKGGDSAASDIDLMVVSDGLSYGDLYLKLDEVSRALGRNVNPTLQSRQEIAKLMKAKSSFLTRVLAQPKIWLVGSERELGV